jgi:hypothetical protein
MQTLAGLSVLLFVVMGTVVGIRMLALARRTGGRPELLMGLGLVLICALGYPGSLFSGFGRGSIGEVIVPLWTVSTSLTQVGIASIWLFTLAVFRPGVSWARGLTAAGIAVMVASSLGTLAVLLTAPDDAPCTESARGWLLVGMLGYAGSFLWTAVEGILQRRMALRRLALGLADPVVANRFLLWGLFGLMATGINTMSALGVLLGADPAESLLVLLPMGVLGAAATALMYLAFFPPPWYVGWLRGEVRATA